MKSYMSSYNVNAFHNGFKVKLTFVLALLLAISGCIPPLPGDSGLDEIRDNISVEEARELAPFPVCLPTFVPDGIQMPPRITYHADWGDPMESEIRLRYYTGDQELMIEVCQRYWPGISTLEYLREGTRRLYIRDLLAWEAGLSEANMDLAVVNVTKYQDDDMRRWLLEIVDPASLHANMVMWGSDPVDYEVYTRLSAEEAKKVARSIPDIPDCEAEPMATP